MKKKPSIKRTASVKKKSSTRRSGHESRIAFFPELEIELSRARVVELFFDANNFTLLLDKAQHAGSKDLQLEIRFEAIKDYDQFQFDYGNVLYESYKRKMRKPRQPLYFFECKRSKRKSYAWDVSIAISPARKPHAFQCKRMIVLSGETQIAGDDLVRNAVWSESDYIHFGENLARLIEAGSYEAFRDHLAAKLKAKKDVDRIAKEIDRWKKTPDFPDGNPRSVKDKDTFDIELLYSDLADDLLPDRIDKFDPDTIRAELGIEFFGRFLMDVLVIEEKGKLRVGRFEPHREW